MQIVFDTSTLILLAKVDVLREIAGSIGIVIPAEVQREALAKKTFDSELISRMLLEKKIAMHDLDDFAAIQRVKDDFRIHAGEAQALWLARRLALPLAVDDGPTIKACKILGQPFLTAVHFVAHLAKTECLQQKLALEKLKKLSQLGRYKAVIIEDAAARIKGGQ